MGIRFLRIRFVNYQTLSKNLSVVNRPVVASSYKHSPIKFSNS